MRVAFIILYPITSINRLQRIMINGLTEYTVDNGEYFDINAAKSP